MDIETRTMRMNLQSMSKIGFILTFSIFIGLFALSVIIGALGPEVTFNFHDQQIIKANLPKNNTVPISNLSRLNQQLFLNIDLDYLGGVTDQYLHAIFVVSVHARKNNNSNWETLQDNKEIKRTIFCESGKQFCEEAWLIHEPFIGYSDYNFTVTLLNSTSDVFETISYARIRITVINHKFTLFELWFRFTFLIFTFAVLIFFAFKMRGFKWGDWTLEQKWTAVLLFGLLGYNNPFFPLEILISSWFPVFLDQVFLVSFVCLLLAFWLIMFDGLWKDAADKKFIRFYLPKFVLITLIWATALSVFTWTELHTLDDVGTQLYEVPGYIFFRVFFLVFILAYVFWLVYAIFRACGSSKSMPYLGLRLKFFGVFTLFVILLTAGGILFDFIGPISNNAAEFLSFLSLFNLYTYILAFVYLPSKSAYWGRKHEIGMIRLEEEDEDVDAFQNPDTLKIDFNAPKHDDDGNIEMGEFKDDEDDDSSDSDQEHIELD